ncbi:MAG TPA: hypothetical protein VFY93_11350 [Planctomycetota bacterium]|nr:hypothetical protein [Planctomycetota bacterium]
MRLVGLLLVGVALAAEPRFDDVFDPAKFPEGAERKGAREKAFEEAVKAHGPGAALLAFRKAEAGVQKMRARTDEDYARYRKLFDDWWAWRRQYEADYWKRNGKPPAEYPIPPALNKGYLDQELVFHVSRSLLLQERYFDEWAYARVTALLREAPDQKAVAKGLRDKSPEQRLRCARVADAATAASAARGEEHAGVRAALAEAAPREALLRDDAWPVQAGAIRGARRLGTREAAGWLVAAMERLESSHGRLQDDVLDALEKMSGKEDVGYDPSAWRAWLDALPADWKAKGGGAGEGAPERYEEPQVPGTASAGNATFFGIESGTEAVVYCVQASVAWDKVRDNVQRSVASLPPGSMFGVVAYDGTAHRFKPTLVEQTSTNREALAKWFLKLEPDPGGADPYAGMMAALDLAEGKGSVPAADTIFFLALTKPPDGTLFDAPYQVMQEICARNALLGIRIHCVGQSDAGQSYYLQQIANQFSGFHVNG